MKLLVESIKKKIDEFCATDSPDIVTELSDVINDKISDLLLESGDKFNSLLNVIVLKPLNDHLDVLGHELKFPLRGGRSKMIYKLNETNRLIGTILSDYKSVLRDEKYYIDHRIKGKQKQDVILDPYLLIGNNTLEHYSYSRFKKLVNESCRKALETYKNKGLSDLTTFKDELFQFAAEVQSQIKSVDEELNEMNKQQFTRKIQNESNVKSVENLSHLGAYEDYRETEQLKKNLKWYSQSMVKLLADLDSYFPFLASVREHEFSPLTVFGHRDYDRLALFYKEFRFFLPPSVTQKDFYSVFTNDSGLNKKSIELRNGTLNDYGYLIEELAPYFVGELEDSKKYNSWWADHFIFRGRTSRPVSKNTKAISNMRSNSRKRVADRSPQYRSIIDAIVKTLT